MSGWLAPYRVLDLTDERGLLCGAILARLGAEVIQVEPPGGGKGRHAPPFDDAGRSFYWSAYGAAKKSITLDIEEAADRERLLRLVKTADFLIESDTPGRLAALGLGYADLKAINPALIYVSLTPFGSEGPKAQYADAELILWAAGGPLHSNRDGDSPPLRISVPQAYLHGAADGAAGALIAHFARLESGRGQHVDISVQQSVTQATIGVHLAAPVGHPDFSFGAGPLTKSGKPALDLSGSGSRTRRSKWVVRDGLVEMHLGMGPATGGKTNSLFAWMKEEGALPARFEGLDWVTIHETIEAGKFNEADLEAAREAVARFYAPKTKSEILDEALKRKVLASPINDVGDLLASEHLKARGLFVTVDEDGASRTLPWAFARGPAGMFTDPAPAPALGQHNAEILGVLEPTEAA